MDVAVRCVYFIFIIAQLFAPAAFAGGGAVATFDGPTPPAGVLATHASASVVTDTPAAGTGCLRLTRADTGSDPELVLPLPPGVRAEQAASLDLFVRTRATERRYNLRLLALDADREALFQRVVHVDPRDGGGRWMRLDEPLDRWRWGNDRLGDWRDVRAIALRIESAELAQFDVDDVTLNPVTAAAPGPLRTDDTLLRLAFERRPILAAGGDGLLVATDQLRQFTPDDVRALRDDMARARRWIDRVFGDAVRPTLDGQAVSLLVFGSADDERAFWDRAGDAWRVDVTPPDGGGYTVMDVSTSTWSDRFGPRRPVYLHECVHGLAARRLRLLTGHVPHDWLQEGVANLVQASVYRGSLDRAVLVRRFAADPDLANARGWLPLDLLFTRDAAPPVYAQCATLTFYLATERPDLLRALTRGLADGQSAAEILNSRRTSIDELQADFLAWGRRTYTRATADEPPFPLPPEWDAPR
jgi:hypothetical protein